MNTEDCIDRVALDRLRRVGQDKLVKQMIDIYLDYAPKMLRNALDGERAGDCVAIEKAVHSLKSSAGHIGASAVHDLARRLESLARNKQFDSLQPLLRELETAFEKARLRLEELKPA
jgi:HPt (histidine-containing phosphotransfer) domain-containing protein